MSRGGARSRSGPRPKPTEVHRKEGTQRARHTKEPVLIAGRGEIKAPRSLDQAEKRVFAELLELFADSNLLDRADVYALEGCARSLVRARAAAREVRKGLLVKNRFGQQVENPACKLEREAWATFRSFAALLGLSPSDRARLAGAGVKGKEPETEVEGLGEVVQLHAVE